MLGLRLGMNVAQRRVGGAFNPLTLSPAFMFQMSDASTRYQAGTRGAPGTAAGSTNPVGLLLDKSTNQLDATQGTASARPTVLIDGGGKTCLRGDGIDDILTFLPSLAFMKDFTLVLADIARSTSASRCVAALSTASNDQVIYDENSGTGFGTFDGIANRIYEASSPATGTQRVIIYRCADGAQSVEINGLTLGTTFAAATSVYTGTPTGALFGSSKYGQNAQSDLYAALGFQGALSAPNKALVRTWAGNEIGLTL